MTNSVRYCIVPLDPEAIERLTRGSDTTAEEFALYRATREQPPSDGCVWELVDVSRRAGRHEYRFIERRTP